jgi:hypothetical protein
MALDRGEERRQLHGSDPVSNRFQEGRLLGETASKLGVSVGHAGQGVALEIA